MDLICLYLFGGLWAVAPPMAPPKRENKDKSNSMKRKGRKNSEVKEAKQRKERKQINGME